MTKFADITLETNLVSSIRVIYSIAIIIKIAPLSMTGEKEPI